MNTFEQNKDVNPGDIYFHRPDLPSVDTRKKFEITAEDDKLRVKNENINCLFSNLTPYSFDKLYNDFRQHLNLDFEPVTIGKKVIQLNNQEKEKLIDSIITNWIYYYTINNLKAEVKREDFTHPYMVDRVLSILDKKYGIDTKKSLMLGAKILRRPLEDYTGTVEGRRHYYDR